MKNILLIEDEIAVVHFIKKGLTEEGYALSVALDGQSGIDMALASPYDLIILDIMLPDKNGIEVCMAIRQSNSFTPILFLTALGTPENIAKGLNTGADDYLVKPFKFIELNARIHALLRRADHSTLLTANPTPVALYQIADLAINDDAKTATRAGHALQLTATEYRLLLMLAKNQGKVLSRVDLLDEVWGINFNLGTNVVDVYINYLRKKVDAEYEQKLIHTVIGMGYVLKSV